MFVFIFLIIYTGRDFGPMLKAERNGDKYCTDVQQENIDGGFKNPRAINMLFPVSILIVSLIGSLLYLGEGDSLRDILGSADPFKAMLWASLFSFTTAAIMSLLTKTLNAEEVMDAAYEGFSPMLLAVAILTFAWAIAGVNNGLHTADYVVSLLGENLDPWMLSALIFIVAAATSFATGTSWSTMAILIPLVIPLSWTVMGAHGIQDYEHFYLLYSAVAATMAGSVWGDHCSPISDTTILSSIASSCDHIEHVRTQLPYAMTVAFASLLFAILPTSFGAPWWLGMLLGSGILYIIIRFYGEEEA
jgi:Na+/H+ antiporter NhaC